MNKIKKALRYQRAVTRMLDVALIVEGESYKDLLKYKSGIYTCKSEELFRTAGVLGDSESLERLLNHFERAYACAKESFFLPDYLKKKK